MRIVAVPAPPDAAGILAGGTLHKHRLPDMGVQRSRLTTSDA